jgi:lysophospholipase L1-like esterase
MAIIISQTTLSETLGAKLRRLARTAALTNPLTTTPWTVDAAWTASTAYIQGQVVANGGSLYIALNSGTSAASGGPSGASSGGVITDNTMQWSYLGGPQSTANDAQAPVVTTATATFAPAGLANYLNPQTLPGCYRVYGGYAVNYSTNYWRLYAFNAASGTPFARGVSIGFETDAPKFAIGTSAPSSIFRIIIDGRYYSYSTIVGASGTPNWIVFDFGSTTQRKTRSIVVEYANSPTDPPSFAGVAVSANDMVFAPAPCDDVRAIFISDSILAGSSYGPFLPGGTVPQQVGKLLGWSDPWSMSVGGSGYVNTGGGNYNFLQRIADVGNLATITSADIVILMGSINDIGQSGVASAVTAALKTVRSANAKAPIVVAGLWSINNPGLSAAEAAVQAGVAAFDDPVARTFFIPLAGASPLPVITGSWNNAADTSSTNSTMYVSGDGTHPPDIGSAYLSQWLARAIRSNVLPLLA